MLSRVPVVSLSFAALLSAGSASALELQLPPPGEDVVGQVQVIKAKYEDTFADLGEQYNLGYSEMVAANPGVDPWLPGVGTEVIIPTRFVLPPGPREGVVINLAEYRLYYYPKGQNVVHTYPLGIGREGWGSPIANTRITAKTKDPAWYPPASIRAEHAADGDPLPTVVPPGPDNGLRVSYNHFKHLRLQSISRKRFIAAGSDPPAAAGSIRSARYRHTGPGCPSPAWC